MTIEKLSALNLYSKTMKMIWREKVQLLRLVSPIIVLALAYIALPLSELGIVPVIVLYFLAIYCFAVSAVHIHVNILETLSFADSRIFVRPRTTHFAYLGILVLFQIANGILGALVEMPLANPSAEVIFSIIGICVSLYLVRFYFTLPAITIGDRLSQMLEYTRGRLLRFYLAGVLFLLTIVPVLTVAILFGGVFLKETSYLGAAFIVLVIMYTCLNVFISVVYKEFRREWLGETSASSDEREL